MFTVDELQKEENKHRILQVKYKYVDIDEQSVNADNAMYLAVFKGQVTLMNLQWFSFEFCERPEGRTVDVYKFLVSEFVKGDVTCEVEQLQLPDVVQAKWNSTYESTITAKEEKKATGKGEGSSSSDTA
jgi:hypothetical protein